jgi:hypothetical protein
VWVKGDLDWVLTYTGQTWKPKERSEAMRAPNVQEILAQREAAAAEAAVKDAASSTEEVAESA